MKKLLISLLSVWLLIAFGTPLFLAPVVEKEIKNISRPEVEILDYQRGYFSAHLRLKMTLFGKTEEQEAQIIYSPLLLSGLNWLQLDSNMLTGKVDLLGNIRAEKDEIFWRSHLTHWQQGELSFKKNYFTVMGGELWTLLGKINIDLTSKSADNGSFNGGFKKNGRNDIITIENFAAKQQGKIFSWQAAQISFGDGKTLREVTGTIYSLDKISISFLPELKFPLIAFNDQRFHLQLIEGERLSMVSENEEDFHAEINVINHTGIIFVKPSFLQKGVLALLLKYKLADIPTTENGLYQFKFRWGEKGILVNGNYFPHFSNK